MSLLIYYWIRNFKITSVKLYDASMHLPFLHTLQDSYIHVHRAIHKNLRGMAPFFFLVYAPKCKIGRVLIRALFSLELENEDQPTGTDGLLQGFNRETWGSGGIYM